jgi:hypothetical protein
MRCERVLRGQAWASEAGTRGKPGHALRHLGKRGHALRWRQPGHLQRLSKDPDNDCPRIRIPKESMRGQTLSGQAMQMLGQTPCTREFDARTGAVVGLMWEARTVDA